MMDSLPSARYRKVADTTWPVDAGETGWQLRYGDFEGSRLHAASIVSAYAHLTDPTITQGEAVEALKRARKAVSS